jgi:hypothetical protein
VKPRADVVGGIGGADDLLERARVALDHLIEPARDFGVCLADVLAQAISDQF